MRKSKFYKTYKVFSYQGSFEIFDFISNSLKPVRFNELKSIKNQLRGNYLSSKTIDERVKDLEKENIIKKVPDEKNRYFGYIVTDEGREKINIVRETEEKLSKIDRKYKK